MKKETLRAPKAQKPMRAKFVPCERQEDGGVLHGGTQCVSGMVVYWAPAYDDQGRDCYSKPIRWAKRCNCLNRWSTTEILPPAERQRADLN
jgi:hypothetical protein